ncbi:hypothetical protein ACFLY9_02895, partial [Patescibacteria group bacterium]
MKILLPVTQTFEIQILKLSKYREFVELLLLSLVTFLIPVFIGHPQVFVGIVVNALIVRTALTMKKWKNLPTILLPSLGALTRGILFGPVTVYLVYLIPFIWFGNLTLTFFTKLLGKSNLLLNIFGASVLKTLAIFLPTLLLVKISVIPDVFLKSMGMMQLITAVVGSTLAQIVTKLEIR